jgi:hypothetical protein
MKQLISVILIVLASVAFAPAPVPVVAATESGSVTGSGQGLFDAGAALGAINLDGLELGTGVFIEPNGSATGVFHAVLVGRSLLGQPQNITVEGNVNQGTMGPDGLRADFSGIATVDLGDGTAPLPGVPFSVSTTAGNVVLAIESTTLPAAGLTSGAVTIE